MVLIASAITFAVLSVAITLWVLERLKFDAEEQSRTHEIITQNEILLSTLKDLEVGERGFLLTKNPSFLEPYNVATAKLNHEYDTLSALAISPSLKKLMIDLKPLIDQRVELINQILRDERNGQHELAIQKVNSGVGKQYMSKIRLLMAEFKEEQLGILQKRSQQLHHTIKKLSCAIGITFLLAMLFTVALLIRIQKLKDDAESKLSFRNALLRSADIAIVATDTNFVITDANPAAEFLFGFSAERIIGAENLTLIIHQLKNVIQKAYNGSEEKPMEGDLLAMLDSLPNTLHFEASYSAHGSMSTQVSCIINKAVDRQGNLVGYILLARDISQVQAVQDALKQSEALYKQSTQHLKNIIDSSIDIICTIDEAGKFVEVGAASYEVFGYSPIELINHFFIDFVHPDDKERTNLIAEDVIKGQPTKNFHNRYIGKNGQTVNLNWSAIWSDSDLLMYAIARDETETIKLAGELKATESLLKLAGDISKVGGWTLDLITEQFFWTPQVSKILEFPDGYSPTLAERLELYNEDSRRVFLDAVDKCKSIGQGFDLQLKTRTKMGRQIETRLIGQAIKNAGGEVVGITGAVQDITVQKNLEQALIEAKEIAMSANAAKDVFLSTMSHEIRTPMSGMLGMLELLSYSTLNTEQQDMLTTATESGKNLVRIINDLLDHTKIEVGKLQIINEVVSLPDLINRLQLSYFALASTKNLVLKHTIDPDIAPFHVLDSLRLIQILGNLLSNAIKFTATGCVEIKLERVARIESSEKLVFSVTDTGIGITKEAQQRLFKPFEQASALTTRLYGGTGLGLSISRKLAEMMGGTLELESQINQGSTFTLTIDFPYVEATAVAHTNQDSIIQLDDEIKAGLKLLVVDDHPTNRKLLSRQLAKLNIAADLAENGRDALEKFQHQAYDLVITDCNMPEMDGYELASKIRQIEKKKQSKRVPIIAWTANAVSDARERAFNAGMDDILIKSAELALVKAKILQWTSDVTPLAQSLNTMPDIAIEANLFDLKNITDDAAEEHELLSDYCAQTDKDIIKANTACREQLSPELKQIAHQMKGASRLIGSVAIASACEKLEMSLQVLNWARASEYLAQIDAELSKIKQFLQVGSLKQ